MARCIQTLKMHGCFPGLGTPSRFSAIFIHPVDGNPPQSVGTYFHLTNLNYTFTSAEKVLRSLISMIAK